MLAVPDRARPTRARAMRSSTSTTTASSSPCAMGDWKLVFMEQRAQDAAAAGPSPSSSSACRRSSTCGAIRSSAPTRTRTRTGTGCLDHAFMLVPAQAYVAEKLQSFHEFPPRQKPASFNLDARAREPADGRGKRRALVVVEGSGLRSPRAPQRVVTEGRPPLPSSSPPGSVLDWGAPSWACWPSLTNPRAFVASTGSTSIHS